MNYYRKYEELYHHLDWDFSSLVFVYGSLKDGCWNNTLLHTSHKLGEYTTLKPFVLVDCGFPYAVPSQSLPEGLVEAPVRGELWEVSSPAVLASLDLLEGHPHHYYRTPTEVVDEHGTIVTCWMYQQPDTTIINHLPECSIINGAYQWHEDIRYQTHTPTLSTTTM